MNFSPENLTLLPETSAPKESFKLDFGSGNSDLAKIRPLKNWTPAITWKSSIYENSHPVNYLLIKDRNSCIFAHNEAAGCY